MSLLKNTENQSSHQAKLNNRSTSHEKFQGLEFLSNASNSNFPAGGGYELSVVYFFLIAGKDELMYTAFL